MMREITLLREIRNVIASYFTQKAKIVEILIRKSDNPTICNDVYFL